MFAGGLVTLLSVLPTDRRAIRFSCGLFTTLCVTLPLLCAGISIPALTGALCVWHDRDVCLAYALLFVFAAVWAFFVALPMSLPTLRLTGEGTFAAQVGEARSYARRRYPSGTL